MNEFSPLPPDEDISRDPGDETARRYRFQHAWAAIVCCMLLDDTQDVVEIFCEHHEDVLLKHRDGCFTGQQVKTRASDQPVWKSGDTALLSAFSRFAHLDFRYPGCFVGFRFLTNHPLHSAENAQSINYVLRQIAASKDSSCLPARVKSWLKKIAKGARVEIDAAFTALKKASASAELPRLEDVLVRLVNTLAGSWVGAEDRSHPSLVRAAQTLVDECARASALDHQQLLPAYLSAIDQPEQEVLARIHGKRMTLSRILGALERDGGSCALLSDEPEKFVQPRQGSTDLMFKKLDAGGFSAVSRNSAEDLRDKADYLGIVWTKKLGDTKGLERHEHVRSLVLSDAARSFEKVATGSEKFGPEMREDLRRRFDERRSRRENLFDCSNEHLEGFAYSLTSQCKVQWSIDRPWEDE